MEASDIGPSIPPEYRAIPPRNWATTPMAWKFLRMRNITIVHSTERIPIFGNEEDDNKLHPDIANKLLSSGREQDFHTETKNVLYVQQAYRNKIFEEFRKHDRLNPNMTESQSCPAASNQASLNVFTSLGQEIKYGATGDQSRTICLPPEMIEKKKNGFQQPPRHPRDQIPNPTSLSKKDDAALKSRGSHLQNSQRPYLDPGLAGGPYGPEVVDWSYTVYSKDEESSPSLPAFYSAVNDMNISGGPTYLYVKVVAKEQIEEATSRLALITACALHERLLLSIWRKRQPRTPRAPPISFRVSDSLRIYAIVATLDTCDIYRMDVGNKQPPHTPVQYMFEKVASHCPRKQKGLDAIIRYVNGIHQHGLAKYGPSAFKDSEDLLGRSPSEWLDGEIRFYYGSEPNTLTTAEPKITAGG
ncbi:MAG: hypothetical protein L6R39_002826 [Caloplaca ligustica]|nr:MAG: hypothetical protein L6R39_002826 [Caloplaca ligustica]